ncbi:UDP-N-acetylglucosamine 1-carboxyvinyltransferase [Frisingicoccus sp.]|uniref:UDP-N-acetylglucosamine 1-carboxyvinyltransferase n=1 Tax=Frisingicoccus sp. TaxID=1918627 RepID=UPI002EC67D48|nr:UDP-N-acetylglucosamine 1-carboxyvinyltransferase [Frisingicoccus sp.]
MSSYLISGGRKLYGHLNVQGSKNAVLPIIAASLLYEGVTVIRGCPDILDVWYMVEILTSIGCDIVWKEDELRIDASEIAFEHLSRECVGKMRSSILLLGAAIGRCRHVVLDYPGGCTIGKRPVDIHLKSLEKMGVHITEQDGVICCEAEGLTGAEIFLPYPSVGATENLMMAAVMADGVTWICNAAKEPEIVDLASFLEKMGVMIFGAGTERIGILGKCHLKHTEYRVMGDRIVAGTYLLAAAGAGGEIELSGVDVQSIRSLLHICETMGCQVRITDRGIGLKSTRRLFSVKDIHTRPFPGFPTDLQPQLMAVLAGARGESEIYEHIFENRFRTAEELGRMGADIQIKNNRAVIRGVERLSGCHVFAKDLRGGASLVIAGLMAEGDTIVENSIFVERGYQDICKDLTQLGADIKVINGK